MRPQVRTPADRGVEAQLGPAVPCAGGGEPFVRDDAALESRTVVMANHPVSEDRPRVVVVGHHVPANPVPRRRAHPQVLKCPSGARHERTDNPSADAQEHERRDGPRPPAEDGA